MLRDRTYKLEELCGLRSTETNIGGIESEEV